MFWYYVSRFIFLVSFAINEYMPKAFLLCLVFPYPQFFRNWSHSYCVQPASILNPKREISFYTYCSIWSNDQMMSKGVFAFVCCGIRRNLFFFVKGAELIETGYYWMISTKFLLSWYFAGIVLTNLCGLQDFPFLWPVPSSYWNVRMLLLSCSVTFQFLFCLNWNALLKWALR